MSNNTNNNITTNHHKSRKQRLANNPYLLDHQSIKHKLISPTNNKLNKLNNSLYSTQQIIDVHDFEQQNIQLRKKLQQIEMQLRTKQEMLINKEDQVILLRGKLQVSEGQLNVLNRKLLQLENKLALAMQRICQLQQQLENNCRKREQIASYKSITNQITTTNKLQQSQCKQQQQQQNQHQQHQQHNTNNTKKQASTQQQQQQQQHLNMIQSSQILQTLNLQQQSNNFINNNQINNVNKQSKLFKMVNRKQQKEQKEREMKNNSIKNIQFNINNLSNNDLSNRLNNVTPIGGGSQIHNPFNYIKKQQLINHTIDNNIITNNNNSIITTTNRHSPIIKFNYTPPKYQPTINKSANINTSFILPKNINNININNRQNLYSQNKNINSPPPKSIVIPQHLVYKHILQSPIKHFPQNQQVNNSHQYHQQPINYYPPTVDSHK